MKNKITLELHVPASGQSYELRVPRQLKIGQVADMVKGFLKNRDSEFIPTRESALCDMESGMAYDINLFVENADLENGSRIMIV